jgi:hypothetical protein
MIKLRMLEGSVLVQNADVIRAKLAGGDEDRQRGMLLLLRHLEPLELAQFTDAVFSVLGVEAEAEPGEDEQTASASDPTEDEWSCWIDATPHHRDSCSMRTWIALEVLGRLEPDALRKHGTALKVWGSEKASKALRVAAVPLVVKMQPQTLDHHVARLGDSLHDSDDQVVRAAAAWALRSLGQAAATRHASILVSLLEVADPGPELVAIIGTLWTVEQAVLAHYAPELLSILARNAYDTTSSDTQARVWAALVVLSKLDPSELAHHATALTR